MKHILKSLTLFSVILLSLASSFAYDLTDKDYDIVDRVDEKIFTLVDREGESLAPRIVKLLTDYIETTTLSERVEEILNTVIDDVKYEYYLGEYSEVDIDNGEEYFDDDFSGYEDEGGQHTHEQEEDFRAEYKIVGNTISLEGGKENAQDKEIFTIFTKLIPKSSRTNIGFYKVYNNPNGDTFAYVEQVQNDPAKWNLVVNIAMFYQDGKLDKRESVHTLIHEFTHTLSLGKAQLDYNNFESCTTKLLQEGCLKEGSYLNTFINTFWSKNFAASQDEKEDDFYTNNESSFVSDYASTNPGEDIAESFTHFVLQNKPKNSEIISDKKILFFYKFKELVKLRNDIRSGLNTLK